jgi:hypothetical protein
MSGTSQSPAASPAATPAAPAAAVPAVLDVGRLTYIVDALHEASEVTEAPGCYAPPLLPLFRWVWACQALSGTAVQP